MGWISDWEGSSRDIGLLAIEFVISNFLASCGLSNGCGCEVQPDALQQPGLAKLETNHCRSLSTSTAAAAGARHDCGVEGSRNAAPP